ncbi:MAG: radical SAM protein [Candidatus Odinarchaeota archaeon]
MPLTGVDLLLTYQCTSRCHHCLYRAGSHHQDLMSEQQFHAILESLEGFPLRWIMLFGGEPLLFQNQLYKWINTITKRFPSVNRSIITNGFWAKTDEQSREVLKKLSAAGLTHLSLSYDSFHARFVNPANIQRILNELKTNDFQKVTIDSYFLFGENKQNEYNFKTKELLKQLKIPSFVALQKFNVLTVGRMVEYLQGNLDIHTFADSPCDVPYWLGSSLAQLSTIEIDSAGYVTLCPGITIGNIQQVPLHKIIASYNPDQHPIIHALTNTGIGGLIQLAQEHNVEIPTQSVSSPCHACYVLRRTLLDTFPNDLAPHHLYVSD